LDGEAPARRNSVVFPFSDRIYSGNIDSQMPILEQFFSAELPRVIYLDCSRVQVCDSYALRALITLRRKADERNKQVVIYRPAPTFRKILEATKLTQLFVIAESIDDAALPGAAA